MYWRAPLVAVGVIAAAIVISGKVNAQDVKLIGSGASFPFPIYSAWFKDFSKQNNGVTVDYQAKGSGAGIQDFINHTVDFAASDAAMTDEEIAKERVAMRDFVGWGLSTGQSLGEKMGYLPLPGDVAASGAQALGSVGQ